MYVKTVDPTGPAAQAGLKVKIVVHFVRKEIILASVYFQSTGNFYFRAEFGGYIWVIGTNHERILFTGKNLSFCNKHAPCNKFSLSFVHFIFTK